MDLVARSHLAGLRLNQMKADFQGQLFPERRLNLLGIAADERGLKGLWRQASTNQVSTSV
jgi:hypothetical protein